MGDIPLPLVLLGMELPAIIALLDCWQRPGDHFGEGTADQRAWKGWLIVAILTVPILVGYGIVLGYYYSVVRRNSPHARG